LVTVEDRRMLPAMRLAPIDHLADVEPALRMIQRGVIKGRQLCKGAPWVIKVEDVTAYRAQNAPQRALSADPGQQAFEFQ